MADSELQQLSITDRNPVQEQRYQQLLSQAGLPYVAGGNGTTVGGNDLSSILAKNAADITANNTAQEAKIGAWNTKYSNAVAAQPTITQMATDIGNKLGLPALQKNAQGLTASVAAIRTNQTNATRGFDVNATQLANIIAEKQAELAPEAQAAVTLEQNAESELGTQLGYQTAEETKQLQPIIAEGSMLSDQIARETTGFTQEKSDELNAILTDIKNKQTVSQAALDRANDLAKAQLQYGSVKNSLTSLSPGQTLVDNTGKVIYQDPATSTTGVDLDKYFKTPVGTINNTTVIAQNADGSFTTGDGHIWKKNTDGSYTAIK